MPDFVLRGRPIELPGFAAGKTSRGIFPPSGSISSLISTRKVNWVMPDEKSENPPLRTPAGFTPRTGGLASEYAREMGWGLNETERAKEPAEKQDAGGGTDHDYGAADFGHSARDTSEAKTPVASTTTSPVKNKVKPPVVIVKPDNLPTRKTGQNSKNGQKPKEKIA